MTKKDKTHTHKNDLELSAQTTRKNKQSIYSERSKKILCPPNKNKLL